MQEYVDHLLIYCMYAHSVWTFVFCLLGVSWVLSKQVVELFACWKGGFGCHWSVVILGSLFSLYISFFYLINILINYQNIIVLLLAWKSMFELNSRTH